MDGMVYYQSSWTQAGWLTWLLKSIHVNKPGTEIDEKGNTGLTR